MVCFLGGFSGAISHRKIQKTERHEGSITYTDDGSHLSETKTELKWEPEPKLVDFFWEVEENPPEMLHPMEKTFFSRNCRSKVWVFSGPCVQTMRLAKLTYVLDMPATGIV